MQKQKKVLIAILIALIVFVLGYGVWDIVINHAPVKERIFPLLMLLASLGMSIFRLCSQGGRKPLMFYEKSYQEELTNVYSSDPASRKKLLEALRFHNEENYKKSIHIFNELKSKQPVLNDLRVVQLFLAKSYTRYGLTQSAIDEYKQLLKIDPRNSAALSNLGNLYSELGDYDSALDCYEKAIEYKPDNPYAFNNAAQLYFEVQEYEFAVNLALRALELKPNFEAPASLLAMIFGITNDNENYSRYLRLAVTNGADARSIERIVASMRVSE